LIAVRPIAFRQTRAQVLSGWFCSPWIKALDELRQRAAREGYCYQHVQAITVAIDQYAEKALGNHDYFLNKPYGVG